MEFLDRFHQLVLNAGNNEHIKININQYESDIQQLLQGSGLKYYDLNRAKNYFSLSFFITQNTAFQNTFRILDELLYCTRNLNVLSNSDEFWIKSIELAKIQISKKQSNPFECDFSFKRERLIGESFHFLKGKKFQLVFDNNYPFIHIDNEQVMQALKSRAQRLGIRLFQHTCDFLERCYFKESRFFFPRQNRENRLVPIGLLFNLSINNLQHSKHKVADKRVWQELFDIALHYSSILDIQEYSQFEFIELNSPKVIENLTKLTAADQIYSIDQCNPKDVAYFLDKLCANAWVHKYDVLHQKCNTYRNHFKQILSTYSNVKPAHSIQIQAKEDAFTDIKECIRAPKTKEFTLAIRSQPIVKYDNFFRVLPLHFFARYFLEPVFSCCREQSDNLIGDVFEGLVEQMLTDSGVNFFSNEEYDINQEAQTYLNVTSEKGECDFIVETDNSIIFIETKAKALTTKSRLGNDITTTTDILKSFIHAITQTNTHRILLQKHGQLTFKSNKNLSLNNRQIFQISLSLDNYMALHDQSMTCQLINTLLRNNLTVPSNLKLEEELNKLIKKLTHQHTCTELQEETEHGMYLKTRFYSVFHFIELLKSVESNLDFERQLNDMTHISYGTKDMTAEMNFIQKLKRQEGQVAE